MKKVNIIGAGPAGLFAAYELCMDVEDFDVTIIEKRSYVGGSGLHSDGKLNFHPKIGGDLTEFLSDREAWDLITQIMGIFINLDVKIPKLDNEKLKELEILANKAGIKYIPIHQAHIGSDVLPKVIKKLKQKLMNWGVKFKLNTDYPVIALENYDALLLAPGRIGSNWLVNQLKMLWSAQIKHNPIDVGVRVEVPNAIMKDIVDLCWDAKFHIYSDSYDDFLRTFCVSPSGFVVKETYDDGLFGVNGHSMKDKLSDNTNFAFLSRVNLSKPLENTTEYGTRIAQLTNTLGGKRPIIQRLGDLKKHRRSTQERINRSYVEPTLKNVTPGDISMAYPKRILQNILEGLEKLDSVIPGINSKATLIYAPEIKFYAQRIITNKQLKLINPDLPIFVAGDGAGVSRGIIGAAATGIIAARGILAI